MRGGRGDAVAPPLSPKRSESMPIYMSYPAIVGDVTEAGHKGWIEVSSFTWSLSRNITSPTGAAADREATSPFFSELTLGKTEDKSSALLLQEALQGKGQYVTIEFVRTYMDRQSVYLSVILQNTLVSGFSTATSGERPSESVTLNFGKIEYRFTPGTDLNSTGDPQTVGYDLGAATLM
jgi:type VI secretion system secreted protein Hcp